MIAPEPTNEVARLAALRAMGILDTPAEAEFDEYAVLASKLCGVPIALVSLVAGRRQWLKAKVGIDVCETSRDAAFCAHAILNDDLMVVPDAMADERFRDNPLVTGSPNVRFYAGMPLVTSGGHAVGTICVIDRVPRELSAEQAEGLRALGREVVRRLEARSGTSGAAVAAGPAESVGRPPARRLRRRYAFALATVGLFILFGQGMIQYALHAQQGDARVINIAGRQRMLSQSLSKDALAMEFAADPAERAARAGQLAKTLALWTSSHEALQRGDAGMGLPGENSPAMRALYERIRPHYEAMVGAAHRLVAVGLTAPASPSGSADEQMVRREAGEILAHEPHFLPGMNKIVFTADAEAGAKIARLRTVELVLAALTLVVLLGEGMLIFEPAARALDRQWRRLSELADRTKIDRAILDTQAETKKLALVASRTDNAVVITDARGGIEWVNEGFTRVTGYAPAEVLGKKPGAFLQGPETDPATVALIRAHVAAGTGFDTEIVNYSKAGRKYWLAISVQPIHDEQGRLTNFIAIESDVTERKEQERALREQKELLDNVLGTIPSAVFWKDRDLRYCGGNLSSPAASASSRWSKWSARAIWTSTGRPSKSSSSAPATIGCWPAGRRCRTSRRCSACPTGRTGRCWGARCRCGMPTGR